MIKREKIELIKRHSIFSGIDIGEEKHFVRFIDNFGEEKARSVSISNNRDGFLKLEERLRQMPNLDHNIIFSLEPSGDYWKPLAYYLKERDYQVVLVNPYHTKQSKELIDNSQIKNDEKDAYTIADLCKQGKFFMPVLPEGVYANLREINLAWQRTNRLLVQSKTYCLNFLTKYFPEYRKCFSDIFGKTSFYVLTHFPLPEEITKIGLKRLNRTLKKISKGKYQEEKIILLYRRATESIGIKEGGMSARALLQDILTDIKDFWKGRRN